MKKVREEQHCLVYLKIYLKMGKQLLDAWIKNCDRKEGLDKIYISYFGKNGFFKNLFEAMYKK